MLGNYQFTTMVELLTGVIALVIGMLWMGNVKYFTDITIGERAILTIILGFFILWGLNRVAPYLDELADWVFDKIHQWAIKNMKKNKIPIPK